MFLVLSLVPFICTFCFACDLLLCPKHGGSRFFPKCSYVSTKLQNGISQKTVSLYKTGRLKHISQVSLSKGVQQHMRRNSAKHLVHEYPTFSCQTAGSWATCIKIKVNGIPNHLDYVLFIVCMCVCVCVCVHVCVIYECGCRPPFGGPWSL